MQHEATIVRTELPGSSNTVILPYEVTDEFYVEQLPQLKKKNIYNFIKRMADIIFAVIGIIVTALPMLIIAIMIKANMGGTVFYRQTRLGINGKPFKIIKFRTMTMDAEAGGAQWSEGAQDSRITKLGAALRQYRLDELPQFFNVLAGSMTLVGPRPERPCFYEAFETYIHGFSQRLAVKPGITGLAQVNGGYSIRPEEKILYDIEYIKKRSLWMDFKIMLKTVGIVLHHRDAK
ncbi:MAG: sugar transferase [Ruminococcaceae bacterium]|nr:sugar transferase [Oscillospiraceae bacterium]